VAREQRKLAAILAADVVGYSRLMGRDESGTLARLREHRKERLEPALARYDGRLVKLTGDGALVEFASAVDALSAAIEFQQAVADVNHERAESEHIVFRVGLHLGDLIVEGGDLYGDGVNVAARLEAEAPAGGIIISRNVRDAVVGRLQATFEDLGSLSLKNIERPVRAFKVEWDRAAWPNLAAGSQPQSTGGAVAPALALPDRPSIAVLPFQNMSGDPEQEYFADGIVDDIITALAHMRWLFVIARNSSFIYKGRAVDVKQVGRDLGVRYLLEGAVRKSVNRVRITAQLIDAQTGAYIWAERYDRDLIDIFAVQDEITEQVAGTIEPELLKNEGHAAISRTENLSAWDLVRQGTWHFHQIRREAAWRARELFREALKIDPQMAEANLWLGRVTGSLLAYGWSDDRVADLREGYDAALKAIQIDERNPYAHYALAITSVFSGALERAILAAETAIKLSPSFALGYLALGLARLSSGRAIEAIDPYERGLRLNPHDPQNFVFLRGLAFAQYFAGNREAALKTATRALAIRPTWTPTLETMTICYAALDRLEEARAMVEQMRHLEPSSDTFEQTMKAHKPEWAAEMESMLRKAWMSK
jgi:adenylate cyclase